MFDQETAANNKLLTILTTELTKLTNGAVGVAKQTERKKKQRLKEGKEKLLSFYTLEKDSIQGNLLSAINKINDVVAGYVAKKEAERKRIDIEIDTFISRKESEKKFLTEKYDAKIEHYYSPRISALYEQGSEDASDEEVIPTYSPTYYAKKAEIDALLAQNAFYQRQIDLDKQRIMGTLLTSVPTPITKKQVKVTKSAADEAKWAAMDADLAANTKRLADESKFHSRQREAASQALYAAAEEALNKARAAAQSDDAMDSIMAKN